MKIKITKYNKFPGVLEIPTPSLHENATAYFYPPFLSIPFPPTSTMRKPFGGGGDGKRRLYTPVFRFAYIRKICRRITDAASAEKTGRICSCTVVTPIRAICHAPPLFPTHTTKCVTPIYNTTLHQSFIIFHYFFFLSFNRLDMKGAVSSETTEPVMRCRFQIIFTT